jgi:LuxR family transcriptional regulator, maltose regulon positive regulatory protein
VSTTILTTKLFIPPARKELVFRQGLIERLNQGMEKKLILVSGPAGFGKTTLLSQWVAQCARPVAWLSLDEGDNEGKRFIQYLIHAIQGISMGIGGEILELLHSVITPDVEEIGPYLVNQLAKFHQPFLVVLDDYHVISEPEIHELMLLILENQPPSMLLVISTRSDPPWPLARWRARGELSEFRLQDLRFSFEESTTLLNEVMKLGLPPDAISQLDSRTEGWVAGLHMVALSLQRRKDISGFIQSFSGSHRFIFDYLIDEVLDGLSQEIRDFLLETAILERMCASMCDYIGERTDSQQMLEHLDEMNLFVVPLDDRRSWYRYHHLFGELLKQILKKSYPERVSRLHGKAREWYQQNGLIGEAIHHGLAEGNMEQVADLMVGNIIEVIEHRDLNFLIRWLESLPPGAIRSRPWLSVAYARFQLSTGSLDDAALHLQNAEMALVENASLSAAQAQHIQSYIASIRADISVLSGDIDAAIERSRQALLMLPEKDKLMRCLVASTLGTSLQRSGKFEDAAKAFIDGITSGRIAGDSNAVVSLYGDLIGLFVERGQLYQAYSYCQEALQIIEANYQKHGRNTPGDSHIYFRLSTILRHWNDMEGSLQYANRCDGILRDWGLRYRLNFTNLAIALHAIGDYPGAHQALREAEQIASQDSTFWVEDVKTTHVMFWLVEGNMEAAMRWALERKLHADDEISFLNQRIYRTFAHVRLAQGLQGDEEALGEALVLIPRLIRILEDSGAAAYLIDALIMQAIALLAKDKPSQALKPLSKALTLGEQGGFIWIFVREGELMEKLLQEAVNCGMSISFAQELLHKINSDRIEARGDEAILPSQAETLTERELDILRYLVSDSTIPEIADSLYISIGTVRTHIKHIYRKLNAHSRFEAVTRARELNSGSTA